jgi:diguanylate cyclase (GGDEF)-like protein
MASRMTRPGIRALGAFALLAVIACVAAELAAKLLGLDAIDGAAFVGVVALAYAACAVGIAQYLGRTQGERAGDLRSFEKRLAGSRSEVESRVLLLTHVQRLLPEAGVVVLARSDIGALLTPTFGERVETTPLRGLAPSLMASQRCLRLDPEPSGNDPSSPTREVCELCEGLGGEVACEPLRAAGQAVGALLVADTRLTTDDRAAVSEAARRAAPVLAAQRTVERGERHAATDALTELPNRRAAERELRRLCAQAGRAVSPTATILVELDGIGLAGDRAGDAALLLVARRLTRAVRASDLVARHGGQTFLVLAPDTDRHGAIELAEKLRRELSMVEAPAAGRLTASLGVASIPMDALEHDELLRRASQALATAKALGGNRVQSAEPTAAP